MLQHTNKILEELKQIKLRFETSSAQLLDISDKVYFGPEYQGYVSNSRLGLINPVQGGSPKKYFDGFGSSNICSDSLIIGSGVHEYLLQPGEFILCETVDRPTAKLGYVADECYSKSQNGKMVTREIISAAASKFDYYGGDVNKFTKFLPDIAKYIRERYKYEQTLESGVEPIYLAPKQRDVLNGCLNSVNRNGPIQALLQGNNSHCENTVICDLSVIFPDEHEEHLKVKSKLDNFTLDEDLGIVIINDVKTTSGFCNDFEQNFYKFHYQREFGLYSLMLNQYLQNIGFCNGFYQVQGNCLVVETTTCTHDSSVFKVTPKMFAHGIQEAALLLKLVAYYQRYGYDSE